LTVSLRLPLGATISACTCRVIAVAMKRAVIGVPS
jgi:hypothetical protein